MVPTPGVQGRQGEINHMRSTAIDGTAGGRAKLIDGSLAVVLLALFAPLLAAIFCLLRLEGGTGLVREHRRSLAGRRFLGWRFCTAPPRHAPVSCRRRSAFAVSSAGPVGRFVKAAGLADLPELVNVVRGDISLAEAFSNLPRD